MKDRLAICIVGLFGLMVYGFIFWGLVAPVLYYDEGAASYFWWVLAMHLSGGFIWALCWAVNRLNTPEYGDG